MESEGVSRHVNVNDERDAQKWIRVLGAGMLQLKEAVEAVGTNVDDIEWYLQSANRSRRMAMSNRFASTTGPR